MALSDVDIPHLSYPFTWSTAFGEVTADVVEQDSLEDIGNCVTISALTVRGARTVHPEFGITQLVFEMQPLDSERIVTEILENEPRAEIVASEQPDQFDQLIDHVKLNVSRRED